LASYSEWNEAIATFFIEGTLPGDAFYLSLDDETLAEIAANWLFEDGSFNAVRDFENSVQQKCVSDGRVILPRSDPQSPGGAPGCVAFLGAMVLAAHRMAPEGDISEINYFTRLREILNLNEGSGRPPGMHPPAPEELLWTELNQWVVSNEFLPSAERGPEGPTKYTNYPLSQSLLREGDKNKLEREFRKSEDVLGEYADREKVGGWFFNRASDFSTFHIRSLATDVRADRYEAVLDAVYGVYVGVNWRSPQLDLVRGHKQEWLTAGLYREFDSLSGRIAYHLFPRRQARVFHGNLEIVHDDRVEPLRATRDGHFYPLWQVNPNGGEAFPVMGHPWVIELRIPERRFWVLTRDPQDDSSMTFASHGFPRLGEPFLLLCRSELDEQISILKDEGLINWTGDPVEVPGHEAWVEYRDCLVLSANWDGIIFQTPELFEELKPRNRVSISLKGGLKTERRDTWLEGYLPQLVVTSFEPTCRIRITNLLGTGEEGELDDTIATNALVGLPRLEPGDYVVEVAGSRGSTVDRRHLRVMSWDALWPQGAAETFGSPVGSYVLSGGLLSERTD
jgi:hypothetical protein